MSIRGIAISLVVHGAAAALVSVSAAIQQEPLVEDVPSIPVELVLEMESAPVMPQAPAEEVVVTPIERPVEVPVPIVKPELIEQTASLPQTVMSPPEPELVTKQEVPVHIPKIEDVKPKIIEAAKQPPPTNPVKSNVKPKKSAIRKPTAKVFKDKRPKQVAALAAGKGSIGKKRSTDGKAAEQSYNSKVLARLRAAKTYPAAARGKGIEGVAVLTFTISSSGKLTAARVSKGAGHPLLDRAVLAMARSAAPFPVFPSSMVKSQVTFSVPVQFKIN